MLCDDLEGEDGSGREVQKGGDIRIFMCDSRCCMAETQYCRAIILQLKINLQKTVDWKNNLFCNLASLNKIKQFTQ